MAGGLDSAVDGLGDGAGWLGRGWSRPLSGMADGAGFAATAGELCGAAAGGTFCLPGGVFWSFRPVRGAAGAADGGTRGPAVVTAGGACFGVALTAGCAGALAAV